MTSPTTEKHNLPSTCSNDIFKSNQPMLSFQCTTPNNFNFNHCNNNNSDPSNLLALTMINQALNLLPQNNSDKHSKIPSIQFPEIQTMPVRGGQGLLVSEYLKLKGRVDQSGLLSPKESLVTAHRGHCFWSGCNFRHDIEDNFKKHMNECHHLTSSTLAQVEISLEKSIQLSALLLKEQNHLYNMLLHLDQKIKCLPGEYSPLTDFHYLSLLLNKFKQTPNMLDLISEPNRINNDMPSLQASTQLPLHSNNHHIPHQQYPANVNKTQLNISQQLMENLSTALLRQHNSSYPQTIFSSSQTTQPTYSFNNNILPVLKSDNNNSSFIHNNNLGTPPNGGHNLQFSNTDNNLKDILSQPRSSDSNYPLSDSATSTHIKERKSKNEQKAPDDQEQLLLKNISDREYYRQYAVRPSASYVNLIKTAILESPRRELSLNEIYVWIQSEFSYFRDKEQKWKNAIRHNLSLHKCFQRKHGKLWTFNEKEYNMKKSRNRFQYNVPITGSETANPDGEDFDDDEDDIDVNDNLNDLIKKEVEYNDENRPDDIVLETNEWSNYLQKNSLKSSSSIVDMSMLPNLRTDKCPVIDN